MLSLYDTTRVTSPVNKQSAKLTHELSAYHFLPRPEDSEFAKSYMKRRAGERSVGLLDDHDVDRARERCRVDLIVEVSEIADELANIVHAVHLSILGLASTSRLLTVVLQNAAEVDPERRLFFDLTSLSDCHAPIGWLTGLLVAHWVIASARTGSGRGCQGSILRVHCAFALSSPLSWGELSRRRLRRLPSRALLHGR